MAKAHRWKDYFEQLLNHPPVPCPGFPCNAQEDHGCLEPSESEVHSAVRKLKNGKAPGLCGITAEMLKASANPGIQRLTAVVKQVWQSGLMPSDWKKGIILPIYKSKDNRHSTAKQSSRPASCTPLNGAEWVHGQRLTRLSP